MGNADHMKWYAVNISSNKMVQLRTHICLQWLGWDTASETTAFRIDLNFRQPDPLPNLSQLDNFVSG